MNGTELQEIHLWNVQVTSVMVQQFQLTVWLVDMIEGHCDE